MRTPLVLAVAQPPTLACDVGANAAAHARAVRDARARVVVFPEFSLTGYELDAAPLAPDDPRLEPLVEACREAGAVALVGAPVSEDGRRHIGMLAVDGHGARVLYRKMWLGGDEAGRFVPGPAPDILEIDGWRLGLAICRDTGVAEHAAATVALGIDAYVAGIVHHEDEGGLHAERAQRIAREHGVWVAIASHAGRTGWGYDRTAGCSGIWRPGGTLAVQAGSAPGELVRAPLTDRDAADGDAGRA